jgi:hypothetical protein
VVTERSAFGQIVADATEDPACGFTRNGRSAAMQSVHNEASLPWAARRLPTPKGSLMPFHRRFACALIFLLLAGCAAVGPGGYDGRELGAVRSVVYGTIEKVHPVPVDDNEGEKLVISLDDGSRVAIVQPGWQGLRAGDRVRVLVGAKASRVERG